MPSPSDVVYTIAQLPAPKPTPLYVGDKRTAVQKLQQHLFRRLGTIAWTKANLTTIEAQNVLSWNERMILLKAKLVLEDLERTVKRQMQTLPSKKNLKNQKEIPF